MSEHDQDPAKTTVLLEFDSENRISFLEVNGMRHEVLLPAKTVPGDGDLHACHMQAPAEVLRSSGLKTLEGPKRLLWVQTRNGFLTITLLIPRLRHGYR